MIAIKYDSTTPGVYECLFYNYSAIVEKHGQKVMSLQMFADPEDTKRWIDLHEGDIILYKERNDPKFDGEMQSIWVVPRAYYVPKAIKINTFNVCKEKTDETGD
jgi:hypothetical protein